MSPNRYTTLVIKSRNWLLDWRWLLVALSALVAVAFEVYEHGQEASLLTNLDFLREVLFFGVMGPLAMGIMLTLLATTQTERLRTALRLTAQRELGRQLANMRDWDALAAFVTRFPRNLVPVTGVSLFARDQEAGKFLFVAESWVAETEPSSASPWLHTPGSCQACSQAQHASSTNLLSCQCLTPASLADYRSRYSLSLVHGGQPIAVLYLYFPAGFVVTAEQIELLHDMAAPMSMAIDSAEPARVAALQTQAVEAERQRIARDLHDTLGQSLGFLHFKLDQLATDGTLTGIAEIRQELGRMRDVANEAYSQVRDTLSDLKPPEETDLAAAILKRAQSVGERAHFQVELRSRGRSQVLSQHVQRHVLYLVREVLTNVEKHAHARRVEIDLEWTADALTLSIVDDGQGFEPHKLVTNNHFGLEIMRERAREIKGQLTVESSLGAGTQVSLSLPLDGSSAPGDGVSL